MARIKMCKQYCNGCTHFCKKPCKSKRKRTGVFMRQKYFCDLFELPINHIYYSTKNRTFKTPTCSGMTIYPNRDRSVKRKIPTDEERKAVCPTLFQERLIEENKDNDRYTELAREDAKMVSRCGYI